MHTQVPRWFAAALLCLTVVTRKALSTRPARLVSGPALFVVLVLGLTSWAVADAGSYVVQDLGVLPGHSSSVALGINQKGDVVGWSMGANGAFAFIYTDANGIVQLPGLPDRPRAIARDLNDLGDVVGTANAGGVDIGHAVLWTNGAIRDLGTLGTGSYSEGWGVNNNGQVVGSSYTNGGSFVGVHGFLYTQARGMVDLTPNSDTGSALDINDAGQVTGYKTAAGGNYHAFRWKEGTFADLGVLPGFAHSFGWAINAVGQVTGNSTSASGNSEQLFRSIAGGGLQNLGGTGEHNVAWGLNASGDVVGTRGFRQPRAVLYTDAGGLRDLGTLIDPSLGWVLLGAHDINDAGQIVGYAFNNFTGQTHAVRLQPAIAPPPECTFNCLRSTKIGLSAKTIGSNAIVTAKVTVRDEKGLPMANALVVGRWTQPDGTEFQPNAWTNRRGVAAFATTGPRPGTYTFQVVNIVLSLHTFNPSKSVLSRSITVN
jgi:probable HAF family extracellular repeat protein